MDKAPDPSAETTPPRHHAVPPYLLMSMAAADGAWEAPEPILELIDRPTGLDEHRKPDSDTLKRIATRARQTLLLDKALLHDQASTHTEPGRLLDPAGGLLRVVCDAQGIETTPGAAARTEGQEPVDDHDVNNAYDGFKDVYAFLDGFLTGSMYQGTGPVLRSTVHYGLHYSNAFWDGAQMVMGDGDGEIFNSFTSSLSVIAHEICHALLQEHTNVVSHGRSGALNESIADVFGALVEQYVAGEDAHKASWLIGKGLFTDQVNGTALRSLAAPGTAYDDPVLGKDPQPATMSGYVHTSEDNGAVHLNSGIPNHAFYLFATALGGNAWETAGLLWLQTATQSVPKDVGFATFAEQTLLRARLDHGAGSMVERALVDAWDAVGVIARVADSAGGHGRFLVPAPRVATCSALRGEKVRNLGHGSPTRRNAGLAPRPD